MVQPQRMAKFMHDRPTGRRFVRNHRPIYGDERCGDESGVVIDLAKGQSEGAGAILKGVCMGGDCDGARTALEPGLDGWGAHGTLVGEVQPSLSA
jgi:hypothetical protein